MIEEYKGRNFLLYDGGCPFCKNYVKYQHLKNNFDIELLNARDHIDLVNFFYEKKFNIDDGMLLYIDNQIYYGEECLNFISKNAHVRNNIFQKINHLIFKHRILSQLIYPFLKIGRDIALFILRRKKIRQK